MFTTDHESCHYAAIYILWLLSFASVDSFIFLNDVNFKTRGWIHRNKIFNRGTKQYQWLTIPLKNASQNKKICDIKYLDPQSFNLHYQRLSHSLELGPFAQQALNLYETCIINSLSPSDNSLCTLLSRAIQLIASELGLQTKFYFSSELTMLL